jgi:hypothetical protein
MVDMMALTQVFNSVLFIETSHFPSFFYYYSQNKQCTHFFESRFVADSFFFELKKFLNEYHIEWDSIRNVVGIAGPGTYTGLRQTVGVLQAWNVGSQFQNLFSSSHNLNTNQNQYFKNYFLLPSFTIPILFFSSFPFLWTQFAFKNQIYILTHSIDLIKKNMGEEFLSRMKRHSAPFWFVKRNKLDSEKDIVSYYSGIISVNEYQNWLVKQRIQELEILVAWKEPFRLYLFESLTFEYKNKLDTNSYLELIKTYQDSIIELLEFWVISRKIEKQTSYFWEPQYFRYGSDEFKLPYS